MANMEQTRQQDYQFYRSQRKQLIDALQVGCGHLPNWEQIRSRVLKIMGRDGLESIFLEAETAAEQRRKDGAS